MMSKYLQSTSLYKRICYCLYHVCSIFVILQKNLGKISQGIATTNLASFFLSLPYGFAWFRV